ncbi:MAG: T9SS type A sorting domain-containing protein [Bacteroidales bacterium]|nr:T9SS type A sorting domain-containing protein [Bacteroidales bacterium]
MKKIIALLLLLLVVNFTFAQKINYSVLSSDANGVTIKVDMPAYSTSNVDINGQTYQKLLMSGAYAVTELGMPELLLAGKSIIIPENSQPTLSVVDADYQLVDNFKLIPSKGVILRNTNPEDVPYQFGAAYQRNAFQRESPVQLSGTFYMRDFHGVTIQVSPFDYNPVQQQLKCYRSLTLRVDFNAPFRVQQARKNCAEFNEVYQNFFLNYERSRYTTITESGEILIITPAQFVDAMQPYVSWKIKNGYPTTMVTLEEVGNSNTAVKNYITNFYNEHNLAFVVIVGDGNLFPYFTKDNEVSDNFYTEIVGNDNVPDIILGKISAENATHVTTQVNKFIQYEENPPVTTHFATFMGIASQEGGSSSDNGEIDYQHIRNIDNILLDFTYTNGYELFEGSQGGLDASGNPTAANVSTAVNAGVGIITYCGHGSETSWGTTSFSNSHINNLTNYNMLPFIISTACLNGKYVNQTCFAEAWLRATKNGQPTGAVSTVMSTMSQPWNPPMVGQDEMIRLLTGAENTTVKRTFGGIVFNGLAKMHEVYPTTTSQGLQTMRTWVLFGDPTLQVRTAVPQLLTVSHNSQIYTGVTQLQVSSPVENAKVVLTKGNTILAQGFISGDSVVLNFNEVLIPTDTVHLLVSAFNYIPYQADIPVIVNNEPYLTYIGHQIDNASGHPSYNESVGVTMQLKNVGGVASSDFSVVVTTDDSYVTMLQSTFGSTGLQPNESMSLSDAIRFKVAPNVPYGHIAQFHIVMTAGEYVTEQDFSQLLYAPKLAIGNCGVDDSQAGETANGRIDYGETVTLNIPLQNIGNAKAQFGFVSIENMNDVISFNSEMTQTIPFMAENATNMLNLSVTVNPNIQESAIAQFELTYTAGFYKAEKTFTMLIGANIEDWETGDFSSYDWNLGTSNQWQITTTHPYEGTYAVRSANIGNNKSSSLKLTMEVTQPDTISFYYYVSCEPGGTDWWGQYSQYDYLAFYINSSKKDSWDGEVPWTKAAYPLTAGTYTFEWRYVKDNYQTAGEDLAMIDYISLPATVKHPSAVQNYTEEGVNISCYPNPASDYVVISGEQLSGFQQGRADLFNISGQRIRSVELKGNQTTMNMNDLSAGTYLLMIWNGEKQVKAVKIVKE